MQESVSVKKTKPPRKLTPRALSTEGLVGADGGGYIRYGDMICTCGSVVYGDGWCPNCQAYGMEEISWY